MAAHTTSPQLASGSPTTATSATAGCVPTAASTSNGATHSPPERIDSERRPVMVRKPSASRVARSPVWNQPSSSIASAVASGRSR